MEFVTKSPQETKELGKRIGTDLEQREIAQVFALEGDLGSGKTTFIQGFAEGIGITQRIISPTFILMREYNLDNNPNYENFYHIDLYRLEENVEQEMINLGIFHLIKDPKNILTIEWADKAGSSLPDSVVDLKFTQIEQGTRKIEINNLKDDT